MLKGKGHHVCNFLSSGSEKPIIICICVKQEGQSKLAKCEQLENLGEGYRRFLCKLFVNLKLFKIKVSNKNRN